MPSLPDFINQPIMPAPEREWILLQYQYEQAMQESRWISDQAQFMVSPPQQLVVSIRLAYQGRNFGESIQRLIRHFNEPGYQDTGPWNQVADQANHIEGLKLRVKALEGECDRLQAQLKAATDPADPSVPDRNPLV